MADYFPLISRAVAGLAPNSREARETIYARAREALTRQLTSLDPPIPEAHIWRERDTLEETIRRVEAGYVAAPVTTVRPEIRPTVTERPALLPLGDAPAPVKASLPKMPAAPLRAAPTIARPLPDDDDDQPAPVIVDPTDTDEPAPVPQARRPKVDATQATAAKTRTATAIAVILPALIALGAAAYVMRDDPEMFNRREEATPTSDAGGPQRKSEGRLDGSQPVASATGPRPGPPAQSVPALPVAARAVFFEETANDPRGSQSDGQVIWRLETIAQGPSQPPLTAVRGVATFPSANMSLEITFNRNRDASLPASHTVELVFRPEGGREGVAEIGPIEARDQEAQPGYQMRGAMVPISTNLFLVGLENNPASVEKNLESMRDQRFFAFQFRMSNGKVGAILMEKGPTGDRVFREAIESWNR